MQVLTAHIRPVPEQISTVRERQGQSIALSQGDRLLTYEELDRRADRFAAYITQLGIVAGGTVAICMERSIEWITAALGIMRAGAAYVPLDPAWPVSRLRFAIEDSGATVLVIRSGSFDELQVKGRRVDPYRDASAIAAASELPKTSIDLESLAYIIYTSGATGVPKGVEITHANLVHLTQWHVDAFSVTGQDRASHLAGLGFDAAVWEIWPNLSAGATVCLANDSIRFSPALMQQWMIRERVTIGFVPTLHAVPMTAMEWPTSTALRFLLTGGDVLHSAPTAQLPFHVVNNYGPTECTVVATSSVLKPGAKGTPPIGRPIGDSSVYLLDENGEMVSDGSIGEIYIGGNGVGRGYRNLPDATERHFQMDPFARTPFARMYRTGDRGVRRPDGEIEFRGRVDRQTKIRGQRVELDEIASVLALHESISFATAVAVSKKEETQLVAYVMFKDNVHPASAHELQTYLLSRLPDYMIPNTFIRLHTLPLSPNGKLDFAMLEQVSSGRLPEGTGRSHTAKPTEEKLLMIVREVLENDAVTAEESFFLAGGHSLLGMQLLTRLSSEFGVDISLRELFEAPTVESLALCVRKKLLQLHSSAGKPDFKNQQKTLSETCHSIFWVHYQSEDLIKEMGDGLFPVVLTREDAASLGYNANVQSIAACLLRKILLIQAKGPFNIGGFCLGGILAYEIASQLRAAGHEVSLLVLLDAPNPEHLPYIESCGWLTHKVGYLRYSVKRAARLGPRLTLISLGERLRKSFALVTKTNRSKTESPLVQEICQAAALAYRPDKYEGRVLLLLAAERLPHVDYLPGWRAVVGQDLHAEYLDGRHSDLLKAEKVRSARDVIASYLRPAAEGKVQSMGFDGNDQRDLCKALGGNQHEATWRSNVNVIPFND